MLVMEVVLGLLIEMPDDGELVAGAFGPDELFSVFTSRLALSLLLQKRLERKSPN